MICPKPIPQEPGCLNRLSHSIEYGAPIVIGDVSKLSALQQGILANMTAAHGKVIHVYNVVLWENGKAWRAERLNTEACRPFTLEELQQHRSRFPAKFVEVPAA